MAAHKLLAVMRRSVACAALVLVLSPAWADSTSLEINGLLFDGSGNLITASPYMIFTESIYDSATGGNLLSNLGTERVQVHNGSYLQVFSLDDSLFSGNAYLQVNLNGFDMGPRLGILFNGSYYFASGVTSGGPAASTLFQMYAGLATPQVPEPGTAALILGGFALLGGVRWRRRITHHQLTTPPPC